MNSPSKRQRVTNTVSQSKQACCCLEAATARNENSRAFALFARGGKEVRYYLRRSREYQLHRLGGYKSIQRCPKRGPDQDAAVG